MKKKLRSHREVISDSLLQKKQKTQNYNTIFNVYYNIAHIDVLTNAETTIYTVKHQRKHELCE